MSYSKFLNSIEVSFEETRDRWIADKRFPELFAFIHENYDSGQWDKFLDPLEKHLLDNSLQKEFVKLWKGLLRHRINDLWDWKKDWNEVNEYWNGKEKTLKQQRYVLEGLNKYISGLQILNAKEELKKAKTLKSAIENLEKPKPKLSTDKRKIDEQIFWELIDVNRSKSEDKFEFINELSDQLETFKPSEIKRFERIFRKKFNELNHWDLWALSYIARSGCGDDCFDYFRSWVISLGEKAFDDIKNLRIEKLQHYFLEEPQLEEMLYLAENVYELKTGELMPQIRVKKQNIKGKEWEEDQLDKIYPELVKLFDY